MSEDSRARIAIDHLFDEGRRGIVLFAYILGLVSWDGDDNPYQKNAEQAFIDAISRSKFLVSSGYFVAGNTSRGADGAFKYYIFDTFGGFVSMTRSNFEKGGIEDIDLLTQTWLRRTEIEGDIEHIPPSIENLFEHQA